MQDFHGDAMPIAVRRRVHGRHSADTNHGLEGKSAADACADAFERSRVNRVGSDLLTIYRKRS
jgi:hypothetical protein